MGNYCATQKDNLDIDTTAKIKSQKVKVDHPDQMFMELFQEMDGGNIKDDFPKYKDIQIIRAVQSATIRKVLREPIKMKDAPKKEKVPEFMSTLARANWPYYIESSDGKWREPVSSIDCLIIYQRIKKIRQG